MCTGSGASTIPIRTIWEIYHNNCEIISKLTYVKVKLRAHNGETIKYIRPIFMNLNHQGCHKTKFLQIDMPEKVPPVLGLQNCERLSLITVHSVNHIATAAINRIQKN